MAAFFIMNSLRYTLLIFVLIINKPSIGSDLGTTGLIDIPTARMMNDGDFRINFSSQKIANITNLTYQATPWLETTFRYTIFNPDNPIRNSYNIDGLSDRSYAAKIRLKRETNATPEISFGVQDIIGTGAWSAEYLVASKKINHLDFTIGFGWGRLAERKSFENPFGLLSEDFKKRGSGGGQKGGKLRLDSFFTGRDIGLFGGISYNIPNSNFKFLAEYNSDSYDREIKLFTINDSSPISYGVEWSSPYNLKIGLSRQQKNQWAFSISSKFNTKWTHAPKMIQPFYSSFDKKDLSLFPDSLNYDSWYDRFFFDLDKSGILLRELKLDEQANAATIEITNNRYILTADAIKRVLILSQIHLPQNINNINIIVNDNEMRIVTISYYRGTDYSHNQDIQKSKIKILPPRIINKPDFKTAINAPYISNYANLGARFQLFDPDTPLKHQFYLNLKSIISLGSGWNLVGSFAVDLKNNFDEDTNSSSQLPKVRTDIDSYLKQGRTGISSLYFEKKGNLSKNVFYRSYFGILEDMYSGIGSELLFMPFKARWAIGTTINSLKKRGFKRNFSHLKYEATTAFLSFYYASAFYNYDLALHIGQYLAKDKGGTFEIRRTFDNGFSIGAFATLTEVPASVFGEGSFDKGLYFKIPFNSFLSFDSKNSFATVLRSVQRDGGQKLDDFTGRLWHDIRGVRYDSLNNNLLRMMPE
jgi:hypothetical protein